VKKISVDRSRFESSYAKRERLLDIYVKEGKPLDVISKINSKIKAGCKISYAEFKLLTGMMFGNKFDKPLKFNSVRNVIKKIIWKLALEELEKKRPAFYKWSK
jgi:CRISPR/Cas system-associated protein Cas7 (RAMP superfamily)